MSGITVPTCAVAGRLLTTNVSALSVVGQPSVFTEIADCVGGGETNRKVEFVSRFNWPIGELAVPASEPAPRVSVPAPMMLMTSVATAPAPELVTAVMLPAHITVPFEMFKVPDAVFITV